MSKVKNVVAKVKDLEGFDVRIINYQSDKKVDFSYDYKRAAPASTTVSQWIRRRMPDVSVEVLNAIGSPVHGRTILASVRRTYE